MMSKFFRAQVWAVTMVAYAAIAGTLAARNHSATTPSGVEEKCVIVVSPRTDGKAAIAPALEEARPGCTIRLRSGLYKEIITISKPISLAGEAGVVLDPSGPLTAKWVRAEGYGNGVYRETAEQAPDSLLLDGKFLAQVNLVRPETQPGKPWDWKRLLADGPPRTGLRLIKGLWLYLPSEKAIFVHLENNVDPSRFSWSAIWSKEPIITMKDTKDASVRDVSLAHGFNGITITGKCLHCSVTRSTIGPWDEYGVQVLGGAAESVVAENEIFRGAYESWVPVTDSPADTGMEISKDWYEIWQVHKLAGFWDRVGVSVTLSGANNHVQRNRIHDVFDGINLGEGEIESLDAPVAEPKHDEGTEISENVIEHTADSGIEVGGPAVNVRIHHNILRNSHGGLRYKLPRVGPVFIYRNILLDGSPNDIWYSLDDSPAEGYVYHNTIVGGRTGLAYHRMHEYRGIGAPHWHYLNNLVVAQRGFFETRDRKMPVNFFADYNVVQGGGKPYPNDSTRDRHSRYVEKLELSGDDPPKPLSGSAAIDAGLDLSKYFHGDPLPGCEPGYFKGPAPDAGALEVE
jgi:Right handed beta helix region